MAPLIQDCDASLSSQDDVFDHKTTVTSPLHKRTTSTAPRRVSFRNTAKLYIVTSRFDYTQKEWKASWYDHDEETRRKQNLVSEVQLANFGLLKEAADCSIRGLESRTRKGSKRKMQNRRHAYTSIFSEIGVQQKQRKYDEELIADAYFAHSEPCAVIARMMGKRDEMEALEIYHEH